VLIKERKEKKRKEKKRKERMIPVLSPRSVGLLGMKYHYNHTL
jgi:hypothetical protein